jgi:hypothetical protein
MERTMGKIIFISVFLLIMFGCGIKNDTYEIYATADVLVFPSHEDGVFVTDEQRTKKSIAVIRKGETLGVLGSYPQKDYLAYKVRTADGVEGFVIHGDGFVVSKKSSTEK